MSEPNLTNEEIADKTRQSLLWFTIVPFTMQVLRFAVSILLARILSPHDFGLIGIISVLLYYCDSFSDFGFSKAIVQKKSIITEHYSIFFTFNIAISMCFFIAAQGFSGSIASFFETPDIAEALQFFSFLFLISAVSAGPLVKLNRELNFKAVAIIQAIRMSITMSLSLILALKGFAFWSIIYATLFSHVIELLLLLYTTRLFPRINLEFGYLKELFHFGLWDFIGAQCRLLSENVDKIIIGKVLGTTSLGYFDKAYGIARMPNDQISVRLSLISFSSFSRVQDDKELLEMYFAKMMIINSILLFPIFLGLFWVADSFILALLGAKWESIVTCFKILLISYIFSSLGNPVISLNKAASRVKAQTLVFLVLVFPLIGGLIIAVPYGIEAAAGVILAFNLLLFLSSYALLRKHSNIGWRNLISYLTPAVTLVGIMCLVLFLLDNIELAEGDWDRLVLFALVGGMTYFSMFLLLPFNRLTFLRKKAFIQLSRIVRIV